jgi:transcriptional regulator with XRE-family HTH domain
MCQEKKPSNNPLETDINISYNTIYVKKGITATTKGGGILMVIMPRISRLTLPSLKLGKETIGQRIARLRKARGYTQVELAEKIGLVQNLISDYERDKLRLHAEMVIRVSDALEVSTDELLGRTPSEKNGQNPSLRLLRRLKKIETLTTPQQKTFLKTIDLLIKGTQGVHK